MRASHKYGSSPEVHQPPRLGFRGAEGSCSLEPQGLDASLMDLPDTEALELHCPLLEEVTCPSIGHCTVQAFLWCRDCTHSPLGLLALLSAWWLSLQ